MVDVFLQSRKNFKQGLGLDSKLSTPSMTQYSKHYPVITQYPASSSADMAKR